MFQGFNADQIENIEFSFCIKDDDRTAFHQVPTDRDIKKQLEEMFTFTVNQIQNAENPFARYEISEKYGSKESLVANISDEMFDSIINMRDAESEDISSENIENADELLFYRVTFHDNNGNKVTGIRKASYFKSILKQRSRLVRLYDDSLESVEDKIFKLDYDFDFFIYNDEAYILRPTNFEFLASISDEVFEQVVQKVEALEATLAFIDFETIKELSSHSKRAAKLIISISSRSDLENISEQRIIDLATANHVSLEQDDDSISPSDGHEIAFLELLDRRRYTVELINGNIEAYRAPSRQAVV